MELAATSCRPRHRFGTANRDRQDIQDGRGRGTSFGKRSLPSPALCRVGVAYEQLSRVAVYFLHHAVFA